MTFTSPIFFIGLLPWFVLLFYIFRKNTKARSSLLLLANTMFYILGGIQTFLLVMAICIVTWFLCKLCFRYKNKMVFVSGCVILLLPLLTVKYTEFALINLNSLMNLNFEIPEILIPIGISFFTFQAISCFVDIYQGKIEKEVKLFEVILYLTFFPTVISGPIIRITNFRNGLKAPLRMSSFNDGVHRIMIGLCKKVLIADKIALLADYYFNGVAVGAQYSTIGLWIGSIAYTLQLYFDFSGYSDMAVGIGKVLGFNIPENFNRPYLSRSIQEFWKRWHITLSNWFRDYVYIPLGGNRCSTVLQVRNMAIVWILTGIWHGANWTFFIWGIGYLVILLAEKYIHYFKNIGSHWYGHIYALFIINLLWIPFRSTDINSTFKYISGMFGYQSLGIEVESKAIRFLPFLLIAIALCMPWDKLLKKYSELKFYKIIKSILLLIFVGLSICALINASYTPYIYGDF